MKISKTFSTTEVMGIGWRLFKQGWGFFVPAIVVTFIVLLALQILGTQIQGVGALFLALALWITQALFMTAWTTIYLQAIRKQSYDWSSFAENARLWWKLLLGGFLFSLFLQVGFLLIIIPGFYFMIKYQYFFFILIDNPEIGIWESFLESARITKGARWKLYGFWWVIVGAMLLGLLALGVGIFVAMLVIGLANTAVYIRLKDQSMVKPEPAEIVE
jgi:uncharacterized membrane protein